MTDKLRIRIAAGAVALFLAVISAAGLAVRHDGTPSNGIWRTSREERLSQCGRSSTTMSHNHAVRSAPAATIRSRELAPSAAMAVTGAGWWPTRRVRPRPR